MAGSSKTKSAPFRMCSGLLIKEFLGYSKDRYFIPDFLTTGKQYIDDNNKARITYQFFVDRTNSRI